MNNLLWAEWSNVDEDNAEEVKYILKAFDDVINGLMILQYHNYIFNNLNSSPEERNYYFDVRGTDDGFIGLSAKFERLKSILFGGVLNWGEIKRSLE
jgi:hypothetical protein